jgi:methylglyoxal synthase
MKKNIVLIAHDNLKDKMVEWARLNKSKLTRHNLMATGTTGKRLSDELKLKIKRFKSGPLGGDLQVGSKITEGKIDVMIFFWDPLSPHPHDVDVKALLRIAAVYDIAVATNPTSADHIINSPYMRKNS